MKVDRNTPIPLYYQLQQHFLGQIHSGELSVGDRLPSEEEIIEESGLSRFTVRQAFQALEREGYVERIRGKGTFVREPRVELSVAWHLLGFTEDMVRRGHKVESEIIGQRLGPCVVDDAARHLGIREDVDVVHFDRTRTVDGIALVYDSVSIRADLCAGFEVIDMTNRSLFETLEKECNLTVARAHRTLTIERAEPQTAEFFKIEIDDPIFMLTDLTFDPSDEPIFYAQTYINPLQSEFVFELFRDEKAQKSYMMDSTTHPTLRPDGD